MENGTGELVLVNAMRTRRAASQVAAIAISLVVISIVTFGVYGIVNMDHPTPNSGATVNTSSTNLDASQSTSTCFGGITYTTSQHCSQPPLIKEEESANSTNQTLGLELFASVNATAVSQGQTINVNVSIYNTLSKVNNVTGASDWAFPSLSDTTSFPCHNYVYYQVYQGYYIEANVSSVTPLQVSPLYQYLSCPILQRSYYLMQPLSDEASVPVGYSTVDNSIQYQSVKMSISGELIGDYITAYNASIFTPNGVLNPPSFPPGTYTLAAGDEWGQLVILHFTVEPNPMTTTAYTTTTCLQPTGNPVGCATTTSFSQSQSATSTYCTISAEPTGFYLHVVTDGTPLPIQGAVLNATAVSICGAQTSSQTLTTNATGWVTVPIPQISGNYFMVFQVQYTNSTTGEAFSKFIGQVGWAPEQGTFVTLSLPSGTVNFSYLFPISCNGECHYMNIPQWVTIVRTEPTAATYSIQLWTNNTLESPTITNLTLLTTPSNQTQVLKFYVPSPSYVFSGPSSFPATNTNSSSFYLVSYPGGTIISTTYYETGNLLYTNQEVQGWIEIYFTAR